MPTLQVEGFEPIEVEAGRRLVLALEDSQTGVLHRCGGHAKCTTCLVEFLDGEPSEMTEAELAALRAKDVFGKGRLSCQIHVDHDMHLRLARTTKSTGLEAGPLPTEEIEPPAVFIPFPG